MQISLLVPTALISICMHWIRQWLKGELHGLGAFVRILQGELLSSTQFYSMYIFRHIWTRRFHLKSYNPSQIIIRHSECKYHNGTCDGLGRTFEYQRGVLWNEFLCCLKLSCQKHLINRGTPTSSDGDKIIVIAGYRSRLASKWHTISFGSDSGQFIDADTWHHASLKWYAYDEVILKYPRNDTYSDSPTNA